MCFTSSDRSDDPPPRPAQVPQQRQQSASVPVSSKASIPQDFAPPSGPPPSHRLQKQAQEADYTPPSGPPPSQNFAPPPGPPPSHRAADEYAPPSGPPPSHDYVAPTGPPPSKSKNNPFFDDFAPPSGAPPSHGYGSQGSSDFAPPPGPPPTQDYAPPPGPPPQEKEPKKHDWEVAVPDTSLLPPPPSFFSGFDRSPANNATEEEAEAGERWCSQFPLNNPLRVALPELNAMNSGNINMFAPPFYRGTLNRQAVGVWRGQTQSKATDTCLATYPPLYSVSTHSPIATGRRKLIYYEVRILQDSRNEVSLALGYTAPPYPPFRLPGWHRGSLGVHGDDGNKYINDRWGGKSFTHPFRRGETLGLGMDFLPAPGGGIGVEIFLTRDGVESGRWNLHEETDQEQDLPVTGLEGFHDICASVGVFDKVSFEIVFVPEAWRWQGWRSY
ncbi:hypothetical protein GQX73_g3592 [Xylaria multiplex]|uniref:SPRY domain-containing protein n=1 Tax=Xylaria multiplex TaxID=323545 RepID=A0A7C8IV85_9PEZI|nr:hypothetical protein GQX73_g3592 [Xylaria multiplex]